MRFVLLTEINECAVSPSPCDQLCTNSPGSFECSCYIGYALDNDERTCNGMFVYYTHAHTIHTYIHTDIYTIHTHIHTHNTYVYMQTTHTNIFTDKWLILDIDECENSPCQQTCSNTMGSFQCSCKTGYTAVGTRCEGQQ